MITATRILSADAAASDAHTTRRVLDNGATPDGARASATRHGSCPSSDNATLLRRTGASFADGATKRPARGSGALVTPSASVSFAHGTAPGTNPSITAGRPANHSTYLDVHEDHNIVPAHSNSRPSVLQSVYKRLLPGVVWLSTGDEQIIVILVAFPGKADAARAVKRLLPGVVWLSTGDKLIIVILVALPGKTDAARAVAADIARVCKFYRLNLLFWFDGGDELDVLCVRLAECFVTTPSQFLS